MDIKEQIVDKEILEQIERVRKNGRRNLNGLTPSEIAKEIFGFEELREKQKEIIEYILKNKNVLGIIPTGGGKSVCFQIPALIQENLTVVISPLISLMKDQVGNLVKKGIDNAFFVNSSISEDIQNKIFELAKENKVNLLYLSPESLQNEKIQDILSELKIDLIVIDEVHCISTWGHQFRPDYLRLPNIIKRFGNPPILALTATATKNVINDIVLNLKIKLDTFKDSFDRPNLKLNILNVLDNNSKEDYLFNLINKLNGTTIIFVRTIKICESLSLFLKEKGIENIFYHGKMKSNERKDKQDIFMQGKCNIMVATNAFGMGIDKLDIRNIIHYNIPKSVEGYYQEIGRSGRDGRNAECILLFTPKDIQKNKNLISFEWPNEKKIKDLISYLKNQNRFLFLSLKDMNYKVGIKQVPLNLILHRLEENEAIKIHRKIPYELFIFSDNPEELINLSEKEDWEDLSKIIHSNHFKNEKFTKNLEVLTEETKLNYFRILSLFRKLKNEKRIKYDELSYTDLIIINKKLSSFDVNPLVDLFNEILNKNYTKIDDLVTCITNRKCIRKNILEYFDERYTKENCGACSICLGNNEGSKDITKTSKDILNCIKLTNNIYGVNYITGFLCGKKDVKDWQKKYYMFNTYDNSRKEELKNILEYLINKGYIKRHPGKIQRLSLTGEGIKFIDSKDKLEF